MFVSQMFYGSGHGERVWRWKITASFGSSLNRNRKREFFSLSLCFKNFSRVLETVGKLR